MACYNQKMLPELPPEKGWIALENLSLLGSYRNFSQGEMNAQLFRLSYYKKEGKNHLVGKVWFGPGAEGPPKHAHGGSIAGVMDEIMGSAAWLAGYPVLAAKIEVQFVKLLPLKKVVWYEAEVTRVIHNKVYTSAKIFLPPDTLYATSKGLFILLKLEKLKELDEKLVDTLKKAGFSF